MSAVRGNHLTLIPPGLALLVLLLAPVLTGPFFADDFQFRLTRPARYIVGAFATLHPYKLYRPIQLSLTALGQTFWPVSTLPIHVANLALHGLLMALVLRVLAARGAGRVARVVAVAALVTAPLNAAALGSNDTLSLVLATLAGLSALWWMLPGPAGAARHPNRALAAFGVALLAKESGLGYLVPLMALALRDAWRAPAARGAALGACLRVALLPLGAGTYLVLRAALGGDPPVFGPEGYFALGANVPRNLLMLEMVPWLPTRTLDVFTGVIQRHWTAPLVGGALGLVLGGGVVLGLGLAGRRRDAAFLLLGATAGLLPVLPMKRVTELYAFALLPATALLMGEGIGALYERSRGAARALLVGACAALFLAQAVALHANADDMAANGRRATRQLAAVEERLAEAAPGSVVYFVEPAQPRPDYSLYRMQGFRLTPPWEVARLHPEVSLELRALDPVNDLRPTPGERARYLTLAGERVVWCDDPRFVAARAESLRAIGESRMGYVRLWKALARLTERVDAPGAPPPPPARPVER